MDAIAFQRKWIGSELKERSAAQEHFLDLFTVLGHPTPADLDGKGDFFSFERGAAKSTGGQGWADVWYRGHFAWEYKGPHKDVLKAHDQLLRYKDDLENPPLLIVSDLDTIEIHTNFIATPRRVHRITLHTFADANSQNVLRRVFHDPDSFKPTITVEEVTHDAARRFGAIGQGMHSRGEDPHQAAHSLMQRGWQGKGNHSVYQNSWCFETFPLPWPPETEPVDDPQVIAIGEAAASLDRLGRLARSGGRQRAELKKRTLTNLYNARPTWLQHAHAGLERAVWGAYGWDDPDTVSVEDDTMLSRLLALNVEPAEPSR